MNSQTTITTAKLSELTIDPANARKTGRGGEPKYAASIEKRGVLIPLTVRRDPASAFLLVTDGGERLTALQHLRKAQKAAAGVLVTDDFEVPVHLADRDEAAARSTSVALNLIRSDMHPVDEFEAFAQMVKDGASLEDIAKENARPIPAIRQALSLASIAPEIRAAWREDKVTGAAAEAYAQTQDLEHQVRVFKKLKGRAGDAWAVNQEIKGGHDHNIATLLKFVGQKEYEAAGHQVNPSLFDDDDRHPIKVNNVPALKAMAAKKVEAECERLKADGWGWAVPADEAPKDLRAWRQVSGSLTKDQKALAGCTVTVNWNGAFEVERGFVKPGVSIKVEKTPAQKAAARAAGPAKPTTISAALAHRMSEALTSATATIVAEQCTPDDVLRMAIVGLLCSTSYSPSPVCLKHSGMLSSREDEKADYDFGKELAKLAKVGRPALLKQFASLVGMSIDLQTHQPDRMLTGGEMHEDEAALVNFVSQPALQKALLATLSIEDYFDSAPGAMALDALRDMGVEPLKNAKKAALAKQAVDAAKKAGWLPPQLRTKGYAGPKSKPVAKKVKASSRKKRQ